MSARIAFSRRRLMKHSVVAGAALGGLAGILRSRKAPAAIAPDAARPNHLCGRAADTRSDQRGRRGDLAQRFSRRGSGKLKVAETLHEFRRAYLYNRYDVNVQRFSAEVPQIWQWDDHEVTNNWSDGKVLDARYTEQRIQTLVARATRAFLEYAPMRWHSQEESERVYRHIPYGRDLDLFVIDMRSYRAANGCNVETSPGPSTAFLGRAQLEWLKAELRLSRATWKVIVSDMPPAAVTRTR
jgi:phosphodiesterase/alkaline phosphatase D-like protein